MRKRVLLAAFAALAALAAPAAPAAAQTYPAKPVRIIVPFAPGGSVDLIARMLAQHLSERLNGAFVVDNRAGGGSNIGAEAAAHAAPDGYTLFMASTAQVELLITITAGASQYIKTGKLRALAVTSDRRTAGLPDVPTMKEAGVAGYEVYVWTGLLAPAAVRPEILG